MSVVAAMMAKEVMVTRITMVVARTEKVETVVGEFGVISQLFIEDVW